MSLDHLQHHFMGYLLDSAKQKKTPHLKELNALVAKNSPKEGLQVYAHAYSARLIDVMRTDHEKLSLFLGDKEFSRLVGGYVASHPSQVRSLRNYGEQLPEFLAASDHPEAARAGQLCLFERTLMDVYDSAFAEQLTADALTTLAPEQWPSLTLTPHTSAQLFNDTTAAIPAWQLCAKDLGKSRNWPNYDSSGESWLLWRDRSRVCQFRHLDEAESHAATHMLFGHKSLAATAEELMPFMEAEQLAPALHGWLGKWLTDGLISSIDSVVDSTTDN